MSESRIYANNSYTLSASASGTHYSIIDYLGNGEVHEATTRKKIFSFVADLQPPVDFHFITTETNVIIIADNLITNWNFQKGTNREIGLPFEIKFPVPRPKGHFILINPDLHLAVLFCIDSNRILEIPFTETLYSIILNVNSTLGFTITHEGHFEKDGYPIEVGRLRNLESNELVGDPIYDLGGFSGAAFSSCGEYLLTLGSTRIVLWRICDFKEVGGINTDGSYGSRAVFFKKTPMVVVSIGQEAHIYKYTSSGLEKMSRESRIFHERPIRHILINAEEDRIFTADDNVIKSHNLYWGWTQGVSISTKTTKGHASIIQELSLSNDSNTITSLDDVHTIRIFDTQTAESLAGEIRLENPCQGIQITSDNLFIIPTNCKISAPLLWRISREKLRRLEQLVYFDPPAACSDILRMNLKASGGGEISETGLLKILPTKDQMNYKRLLLGNNCTETCCQNSKI